MLHLPSPLSLDDAHQPNDATPRHAIGVSPAGMDEYPEELRTPPVALVSLVGSTDHHHATISTHLHAQQPPINVLALPDFSKIPVILSRKPKESGEPHAVGGILKRDWLTKHRTRVPAVVAAMFAREEVNGDPAQWSQVCTEIDNVKDAVRLRNVKLVVVVVQSSYSDDMSEDRMIALRKRADIDSKHLIIFSTKNTLELKQSLDRLAGTFSELANSYYKEEGRRIKTRVEKKNYSSFELHVRYCFKVAVYAEFRREWSEAFRFYDESYRTVREMIGSSTRLPPIQLLVEIKSVAEQLHFKMSTLLLHGGKTLEAVTSFRQHKASYKRLVGSAEAIHLHWEWMSRQFLVFAELLEMSSAANQSVSSPLLDAADMTLTEWEFRPAYYYQLAALYLKRKRSALEIALSMWEDSSEIDGSSESVVPSVYVGQFARLLEQGDLLSMQSLTDEDYIRYVLAEGKRFQDSYEIIALLKRCYEFYGRLKVHRMGASCGLEIAKEYFSVGNFTDAKQLFDRLANLHRQEGWVTFLWECLGYLRECSRKLATVKDFVEYSLEMAALPVCSEGDEHSLGIKESSPAGPPSLQHRESIHKEVLELVTGDSSIKTEETNPLKVTEDNPLHLEIDLVSPLRSVLLAAVAFHEQTVKPGASTSITVSLLSQLPLQVEIDQLDIQFNQSECNFTIVKADQLQSAGDHVGLQNCRVEAAPSLSLSTNKWLRLTYDIRSEQSGKLECISIFAKLASHFTIFCRAESPASMDDLPLWRYEDCTETFPTKDPALAIIGQKAIQVEEAEPCVDLNLDASGPALIGERFIVPVTIVARGHDIYAGELKINLVDVRGSGLFSPQEAEPSGLDNRHVELLGVAGAEGEEETGTGSDKINTIQESFGLVSIPHIRNGDWWSCKLEIRWHRPKAVTLFVSLGYFPFGNESSGQKIHVHKSLQIEGKNAITISHRFLLPFRRDPLLLSVIKGTNNPEHLPSLPLNEKNILVVSTRNCTEVPLQLESVSIKAGDESATTFCSTNPGSQDLKGPAPLVPDEEYKKVFTVCPQEHTPVLRLGSVHLKWRRETGTEDDSVITEHKLPDVRVELPLLTVSLECPPFAILGDPFSYYVKITNQTHLLQEVKFSLSDSQSFVMSGPHSSTVSILPKADYFLAYKLVPLASGSLQLPKVMLTSVRYSMVFQSSANATAIFAYPSKPCFKIADEGDNDEVETVKADVGRCISESGP